jgi:hypothetical protein
MFLLVLIISFENVRAQDQKAELPVARRDSLEKLLAAEETLFVIIRKGTLPNARNEIENNSYSGFVISSAKGVTLSIGGFVEADLIHDLYPLGDKYSFTTSSIEMYPGKGSENVTNFRLLNFTGSIQVKKLDNINFQATAGSGFGKYNNDLGGLGYDGFQSTSDTSRISTANQLNFFVFYNHWWTRRLSKALGCRHVGMF